jgi:hypothetical protein
MAHNHNITVCNSRLRYAEKQGKQNLERRPPLPKFL